MEAILRANNLTKTFIKDQGKLVVLDSLNLEVFKGEILCILGASGCGKSTLLRLLAGLDMPDSGDVLMNGRKVSNADRSRIFIFQDFDQLFPWKTVLENVIYPMKKNENPVPYSKENS
jgi:NitT/TauT family transport system ATP-binding protein